MMVRQISSWICMMWGALACAQNIAPLPDSTQATAYSSFEGRVVDSNGQAAVSALLTLQPLNSAAANQTTLTDSVGQFQFEGVAPGPYSLTVEVLGLPPTQFAVSLPVIPATLSSYRLPYSILDMAGITVVDQPQGLTPRNLNAVQGTEIYSARKTEVVQVSGLTANLATNNPRQLFARVAGVNIWESDGTGLQLNIGGRGLSPNRTSHFNTRQNGYDIAADALGYPESYYTPPSEALQRIEVVRGAASLQYGTQFGGLLNFVFRRPPPDRPLRVRQHVSAGSYGFQSTYTELGGTQGRFNYQSFYQYKTTEGWRPNSAYQQHTAHLSIGYQIAPRWHVRTEYTHMQYLAEQPGGLTDAQFGQDPSQSTRQRNWFQVRWNLLALLLDGQVTERLRANVRVFGLLGQRDALGYLGRIDRPDPGGPRDLIADAYANVGAEFRLLYRYAIRNKPQVLAGGVRYYQGRTERQQGFGDASIAANFTYINPDEQRYSAYQFPSQNIAFFAEHIFHLSERLSITPGARLELIKTASNGFYNRRITDFAGNVLLAERITENLASSRGFVLGGIGISYKVKPTTRHTTEAYGNISMNYRAVNFNDLRVLNPNERVDEQLTDERGYNADLGLRGTLNGWFQYDLTAFYLAYNGRIGNVLRVDTALFNLFRFRTNVADARTIGLETFLEAEVLHAFVSRKAQTSLRFFNSLTVLDARYIASGEPAIDGKAVELVPALIWRAGCDFRWRAFQVAGQISHTAEHFSDATNAISTPTAVEGLIPAYQVVDASASYRWRWVTFSLTGHNLLDARYFTRRAAGYPGPGILPGYARTLYASVQFKW